MASLLALRNLIPQPTPAPVAISHPLELYPPTEFEGADAGTVARSFKQTQGTTAGNAKVPPGQTVYTYPSLAGKLLKGRNLSCAWPNSGNLVWQALQDISGNPLVIMLGDSQGQPVNDWHAVMYSGDNSQAQALWRAQVAQLWAAMSWSPSAGGSSLPFAPGSIPLYMAKQSKYGVVYVPSPTFESYALTTVVHFAQPVGSAWDGFVEVTFDPFTRVGYLSGVPDPGKYGITISSIVAVIAATIVSTVAIVVSAVTYNAVGVVSGAVALGLAWYGFGSAVAQTASNFTSGISASTSQAGGAQIPGVAPTTGESGSLAAWQKVASPTPTPMQKSTLTKRVQMISPAPLATVPPGGLLTPGPSVIVPTTSPGAGIASSPLNSPAPAAGTFDTNVPNLKPLNLAIGAGVLAVVIIAIVVFD